MDCNIVKKDLKKMYALPYSVCMFPYSAPLSAVNSARIQR